VLDVLDERVERPGAAPSMRSVESDEMPQGPCAPRNTRLVIPRNSEVLGRIMKDTSARIVPGVTTAGIDSFIAQSIAESGAAPSIRSYPYIGPPTGLYRSGTPYPFATHISVNEEVNWGVPGERVLQEGDLVTIEVGLYRDDCHTAAEYTYPVGQVTARNGRLLLTTNLALQSAVAAAAPGKRVRHISQAIQSITESNGFCVTRGFLGYGIGENFHQGPRIPGYEPGEHDTDDGLTSDLDQELEIGQTLHVIAMAQAPARLIEGPNGVTAVTEDGSFASSAGHVIVLDDDGPIVLTQGPWEEEERRPLVESIRTVSSELVQYTRYHPSALYHVDPHVFERLVGEILASWGFSLEFNVRTVSGEVDILGFTRDVLGNRIGYVIECKRYARKNLVGLSEVTRLHGIREDLRYRSRVQNALLVTTSDFTKPARRMAAERHLDLRNYEALLDWLSAYKVRESGLYLPFLCNG
jgi:methionyl aminopeptidase